VQTAAGSGTVIALDPLDRQQNITALGPVAVSRNGMSPMVTT
jgi:expansin (peptidoglycan-binding protein)